MSQFTDVFLQFIDSWGYYAVAILMGLENACIPIPSELILGFAGYMIFAGRMTFTMAMVAGMVGGILGSAFAYAVGHYGGRPFVDKYGKYFFVKNPMWILPRTGLINTVSRRCSLAVCCQ